MWPRGSAWLRSPDPIEALQFNLSHFSPEVLPTWAVVPGNCLEFFSGMPRPGCPAAEGDDAAAAMMDGAASALSVQLPDDGCGVSVRLH